jgi:hypothetical protein
MYGCFKYFIFVARIFRYEINVLKFNLVKFTRKLKRGWKFGRTLEIKKKYKR